MTITTFHTNENEVIILRKYNNWLPKERIAFFDEEGEGNSGITVSVPIESYSEWQFWVDICFNARMNSFVTVFCVIKFWLFVIKSTVQFERVIV